jgi:ribonuclease J
MPTGKLHIIPLGGMGEFGMNCMAIRWGDDIIVIDAGLMFPEAELLGVDIVVPDLSYLLENRKHVRGIVLTHGHEDHIGALPWLLSELNVPVWAPSSRWPTSKTSSTSTLCSTTPTCARSVPGERFKVGPFTIHPMQVTHSLVDCVALAIHTPLGVVLHTGDFKVDPTPTDNRLFDLHAFAEYGKRECWRCCRIRPTSSARATRRANARCVRKFEEIFPAPSGKLFILLLLVVDSSHQAGRRAWPSRARPQDRASSAAP